MVCLVCLKSVQHDVGVILVPHELKSFEEVVSVVDVCLGDELLCWISSKSIVNPSKHISGHILAR